MACVQRSKSQPDLRELPSRSRLRGLRRFGCVMSTLRQERSVKNGHAIEIRTYFIAIIFRSPILAGCAHGPRPLPERSRSQKGRSRHAGHDDEKNRHRRPRKGICRLVPEKSSPEMPNGSPRIRVDSNNFQAWPLRRRRPKMTICSRKTNRVRIFTVRQSQINRKKGHAGITPHGLCETVPQALHGFRLGAHSVRVEVPV